MKRRSNTLKPAKRAPGWWKGEGSAYEYISEQPPESYGK